MDKYGKKILMLTAVCATALLTMTACGKDEERATSVVISKDGKVSHVIYEPFDQEYYDIQELSDMAASEISEYNVEYSSPKITLEKAELVEDDTLAKLQMTYDSPSDYSHFNQVSLFYGTIEEAQNKGYEISKSLVNSKGEKIEESYIEEHKDKHIIITTDKTKIVTPYNIEYMSNGVELIEKGEAELSAVTTDTVQLLLSK